MSKKIVAILDCGHGKIVIMKRIGDTICLGLKMWCMDCDKLSKVIDIR